MAGVAIFQLFRRLFGQIAGKNVQLINLQKQLDYFFSDTNLLVQAITHKSIAPDYATNYERLEFLGDTVIDHVISEKLFHEFPEASEGILTKKRSALVQKSFLANMGNLLGLLTYISAASSVDLTQEKVSQKQLANVYEAIIGAMHLDGGIEPCEKLIELTTWSHRHEAWKNINYKGLLIEYCQGNQLVTPKFTVTNIEGPEHEKVFEIAVVVENREFPSASGVTKKAAEQDAAQIALDELNP